MCSLRLMRTIRILPTSFLCNVPNCSAQFQNALQMKLHFDLKHQGRLQKIMALSSPGLDKLAFNIISNNILHEERFEDFNRFLSSKFGEKFIDRSQNLNDRRFASVKLPSITNLTNPMITGRNNNPTGSVKQYGNKWFNCWFVDCVLCHASVKEFNWTLDDHSLRHLKKEDKKFWLYKCTLCTEERCYRDRTSLTRHFNATHDRCKCRRNVNYIDSKDHYRIRLENIRKMCFHKAIPYKKPYDDSMHRKSFTRIGCKKCNKCIINKSKNKEVHVLSHLKHENQTRWVYQCLLCPSDYQVRTMYWLNLLSHIKDVHCKVTTLISGTDYIDRKKEFSVTIAKMMKLCFESYEKPLRLKKVPCAFCSTTVPNCFAFLKRHASHHAKDHLGIDWMYSCLICPEKPFHASDFYYIKRHCREKHEMKNPLAKIHYIDKSDEYGETVADFAKICFPTAFPN